MRMSSTKLAALGGALSIVLAGSTFLPPDARARTAASHVAHPSKTAAAHNSTTTHATTSKPLRQTHANFPHGHSSSLHYDHPKYGNKTGFSHKGNSGTANAGGAGGGANSGTSNSGTSHSGGGVTKVVRNQGGSGGGTSGGTGTNNPGNQSGSGGGSASGGNANSGTSNTGNPKLAKNTGSTNTGNSNTGNPNTGNPKTGSPTSGTPHTPHNVLSHGPSQPVKLAVNLTVRPTYPAVHLHNANAFFPIHRAPYRLFFGGVARTFVPLAVLGIARIDGGYWDPDGYVAVSRLFCQGVAENGCMLYWRMVDFDGGGGAAQCVQYCPHAGAAPANFVEAPPHPPVPPENASCDLTIFGEPNFGGGSAPTSDSQPDVGAAGWQNAISSIQIQSGIWDFFSAANFSGESMRLQAGNYGTLPQGWDKKIASFQCVQRSVASAQ
jgi:hypothetical protein